MSSVLSKVGSDDGGRDGETSFQEVCPLSENRSVAARNFFSLLELEKKCCIKTGQEEAFGQISIRLQDQVNFCFVCLREIDL